MKLHAGRGVFLEGVGHIVVEHDGDRITPTAVNEQASFLAREAILETIVKAGPEYAHEAGFLRGWLMLTHANLAGQFHKNRDYPKALSSLEKARQFGYCNWHVRAILALNRRACHPAALRVYFSLRDLMHAVRCRAQRFAFDGGERDLVGDLYKRLESKQP